jgi:hypothetical protein
MKALAISANEDNTKEVEGYRIYLAFDVNTGGVLGYPFSCCGCYDGRTFCSHLLAKLLAFRQVQRCTSIEAFKEIWPPPPTRSQGIPTLFECMCTQELESRNLGEVEKKKKRRHSA